MVLKPSQSNPFSTTTVSRKPTVRDEIAAFVNHCLVNLDRHQSMLDRREDQRYAFSVLISMTPVDSLTMRTIGEPLLVIGKHISASGLGFFHTRPLPFPVFLVSVVNDVGSDTQFVWKSHWCRFLADGWYESGGQFLRLKRLGDIDF